MAEFPTWFFTDIPESEKPLCVKLWPDIWNRTKVRFLWMAGRKQKKDTLLGILFCFWCAKRDLNPYVRDTRPSNVPVCQFQHSRSTSGIITANSTFVNGFLKNYSTLIVSCSITVSASKIWTGVSFVYGCQTGKPSPFGSPVFTKLAQYVETMDSSTLSHSSHGRHARSSVWKTYHNSQEWNAPASSPGSLRLK